MGSDQGKHLDKKSGSELRGGFAWAGRQQYGWGGAGNSYKIVKVDLTVKPKVEDKNKEEWASDDHTATLYGKLCL